MLFVRTSLRLWLLALFTSLALLISPAAAATQDVACPDATINGFGGGGAGSLFVDLTNFAAPQCGGFPDVFAFSPVTSKFGFQVNGPIKPTNLIIQGLQNVTFAVTAGPCPIAGGILGFVANSVCTFEAAGTFNGQPASVRATLTQSFAVGMSVNSVMISNLVYTITVADPINNKILSQAVTKNFMSQRADQLVSSDVDISRRLKTPGGTENSNSSSQGVGLVASNSGSVTTFAFDTSLRQIAASGGGNSQRSLLGRTGGEAIRSNLGYSHDSVHMPGFDIWVKGKFVRIDEGANAGDLGLLYVGTDYRINDGLVVGLLGQFDRFENDNKSQGINVSGDGWIIGPYIAAQLTDSLVFDGRAAWGQSDNDSVIVNQSAGSFDTNRWLIKGQLTGMIKVSAWNVQPQMGIIYFEERQASYVDSTGATIASQRISLGRLSFGPTVSTTFHAEDGTSIAPFVSLKGLWDFDTSDSVNVITGAVVNGADDVRARIEGGLTVSFSNGVRIRGDGFYDGIGANDFDAYGGSIGVSISLN